jgi:hypothetical protein
LTRENTRIDRQFLPIQLLGDPTLRFLIHFPCET